MNGLQHNIEERLTALHNGSASLEILRCRYHQRSRPYSYIRQCESDFMTFVECGWIDVEMEDRAFRLCPGQCLWMPQGTSYRFFTREETPVTRQINVRFSITERTGSPLPAFATAVLAENAWELQPTLHQLNDLWLHGHPLKAARETGLTATLMTGFLGLTNESAAGHFTPSQRIRINEVIVDRLDRALSVQTLAESVNLSPEYFTRKFRQTFGMAPRFYIKEQRMQQAAARLRETSETLKEVAQEVGIKNLGLFCRQFRDVFHCTPTEYRRRG